MSVTLSLFAGAGAQFLDNNGAILSGGLIYTYTAGTTTPLATYTSNLGTVAQPNPIVLDSAGRIPGGELWLTTGYGYKFVTKDSNGVLIGTYDNVPSSAQPPITNDASSIAYEQGTNTTAGFFVIGYTYLITSIGNTNFQAIGATSNTVGIHFIATGIGSGTGTAQFSRTVQVKLQESVSVEDFGAVGDGTTDNTASFQAAIDTGFDVFIPATTLPYIVQGLTIDTVGQTIYGVGNLSWVKLKSTTNESIFTVNVNFVTIRNLSLDGNKANQSTSSDSLGSCVWANNGIQFLKVDSCLMSNPIRNGISGFGNHDVCAYTNNTIMNPGFCGILPSLGSGNLFSEGIISGNYVQGAGQDGIGPAALNFCSIVNNVIKNATTAGISLEGCYNITVSGNVILGTIAGSITGIQVNESRNITVSGNSIREVGQGIWAANRSANSYDIAITGNTLFGCNNGILIDNAVATTPLNAYWMNVTCTGNSVQNSNATAIGVNGNAGAVVSNNTVTNWNLANSNVGGALGGITLSGNACYNLISNNFIRHDGPSDFTVGIYESWGGGLAYCARNNIINNTIIGPEQDILVTLSSYGPTDQSTVIRNITNSSAPSTYTWLNSQSQNNSIVASAGYIGWVCTVPGSFGTLPAITATTTNGQKNVVLSSTVGIYTGMIISIAGAATAVAIENVDRVTNVISLYTAATGSVSGVTVTLANPTFSTFGLIS